MGKPDPRAEPDSIRAPALGENDKKDLSVDRVVSEITAVPTDEPASGVTAKEPAIDVVEAPKKEPTDTQKRAAAKITSVDPRFAELEPFIETNDWKSVAKKLGPIDAAGALPPNLGLIAAIAHHESSEDGGPDARALAIRCTAGLLGLPADNEVVRILSRRMLRKNVVRFREVQAPPARWSAFIVVVVVALGGALGWYLSTGHGARLLSMLHLR
ncbi:MAG TPA: hypothetical protein VIF62_06915 [Labilithrix sp.]